LIDFASAPESIDGTLDRLRLRIASKGRIPGRHCRRRVLTNKPLEPLDRAFNALRLRVGGALRAKIILNLKSVSMNVCRRDLTRVGIRPRAKYAGAFLYVRRRVGVCHYELLRLGARPGY
jgi:hypothetical protein